MAAGHTPFNPSRFSGLMPGHEARIKRMERRYAAAIEKAAKLGEEIDATLGLKLRPVCDPRPVLTDSTADDAPDAWQDDEDDDTPGPFVEEVNVNEIADLKQTWGNRRETKRKGLEILGRFTKDTPVIELTAALRAEGIETSEPQLKLWRTEAYGLEVKKRKAKSKPLPERRLEGQDGPTAGEEWDAFLGVLKVISRMGGSGKALRIMTAIEEVVIGKKADSDD